ncbi:hypothetical protein STEG23_008411, partial [Scotinomys teguina]
FPCPSNINLTVNPMLPAFILRVIDIGYGLPVNYLYYIEVCLNCLSHLDIP